MNELTESMEKTLLQIGFGVFGRAGGYYDEKGDRIDMRSADALHARGLVSYRTTGGQPLLGCLDLTPAGWEVFELVKDEAA